MDDNYRMRKLVYDGGHFSIFEDVECDGKFYLYEIPQYGGEEQFYDEGDDLHVLIERAKNELT